MTPIAISSNKMFNQVVFVDRYGRDWESCVVLDASMRLGYRPDSSVIF